MIPTNSRCQRMELCHRPLAGNQLASRKNEFGILNESLKRPNNVRQSIFAHILVNFFAWANMVAIIHREISWSPRDCFNGWCSEHSNWAKFTLKHCKNYGGWHSLCKKRRILLPFNNKLRSIWNMGRRFSIIYFLWTLNCLLPSHTRFKQSL